MFQIGDKVRIIGNAHYAGTVSEITPGMRNSFCMHDLIGEKATIAGWSSGGYRLEEFSWGWLPEWLEKIPKRNLILRPKQSQKGS